MEHLPAKLPSVAVERGLQADDDDIGLCPISSLKQIVTDGFRKGEYMRKREKRNGSGGNVPVHVAENRGTPGRE